MSLNVFEYLKTIFEYLKTIFEYLKTTFEYLKTTFEYLKLNSHKLLIDEINKNNKRHQKSPLLCPYLLTPSLIVNCELSSLLC